MMHKYNKFVLVMGTMVPLIFAGVSFADSFRMPSKPVTVSTDNKDTAKDDKSAEYLSLPESAESQTDPVSAYIPDNSADLKFISGAWEFDRDFVDKDGRKLDTKFIFDNEGNGKSVLITEDGVTFESTAKATLDEDKLLVTTSDYKSDGSDKTYKGLAFKCDFEDGVTRCDSDDKSFSDVALLAADEKTKNMVRNYLGNSESAKDKDENKADESALSETSFTLNDTALKSVKEGETSMVIPQSSHDTQFIKGEWNFDKDFTDTKGQSAKANFSFDEKGAGKLKMTTPDSEFNADATATIDDGVLKIRTEKLLSEDGKVSAPNMFIECQNQDGRAVCRGTDGFKVWGNENMLAGNDIAKDSAALSRKFNEDKKSVPQTENKDPAKEASEQFSELDSGSELPPDIMENVDVAKDDGSSMALKGDWRYSQDFSRKSDGDAVTLGFHFDENGKGYSTIGDDKDVARAEAEAIKLQNGSYRVKTEAYKGKDKEYYPTFMECRPNEKKEIKCNVSNGWLRLEDGSLIATDSLKEQKEEKKYEEVSKGDAPQAEADNKENTEALLSELAKESQEDAKKEAQKAEKSEPKKQEAALTLPNTDSTDFLKGKWSCNTGLFTNGNANLPVILDFAFDKNGKGTSIIREKKTGMTYKASVSATYNKNKRELRLVTSDFYNKKSNSSYMGQSIVCHQEGDKALCSGRARDGSNGSNWKNTPFMRQE